VAAPKHAFPHPRIRFDASIAGATRAFRYSSDDVVAGGRQIRKEMTMWLRENRRTIWQSLATSVRIKNRSQLVRHIAGRLGKSRVAITDDMIHVTHYGYDDRIDWDEYIVVVEGLGVFGYTDEPCPYASEPAQPLDIVDTEIVFALAQPRQNTEPAQTRTSVAAKNASLRRVEQKTTATSAQRAAVAAKRAV
jgi:hypothetical protein